MAKWLICRIHREDCISVLLNVVTYLASKYAVVHFFRFYKSGHGIFRMFFFHIQALVRHAQMISCPSLTLVVQYNVFSLIFSWFALANLWLTFSIIIDLLPSQNVVLFGGNNHTGLDIVSLRLI